MKILVATIGFGSGHNRAADAVAERVQDEFPDADVKVVDFLNWHKGLWDSLTVFFYFNSIKYIPSVYHALYRMTSSLKMLHGFVFGKYIKKMEMFLKDFPAELIISTHVFCAKASCVNKRKNPRVKAVWGVLTDFMDDRYWNTMQLDRFYVATEELKVKLVKKGIRKDTIIVAPIPVKKEFLRKNGKTEAVGNLNEHLSPNMFTVLVLGGGNGLGSLHEVTGSLLELPVQILVVTGINTRLKEELDKLKHGFPNLFVYGFVSNVHDMMDIADVCITKPGGATIAECLAKNLPIVIYGDPLPGPETENIEYLVREGFSEFYSTPLELRTGISNRLVEYKTGKI